MPCKFGHRPILCVRHDLSVVSALTNHRERGTTKGTKHTKKGGESQWKTDIIKNLPKLIRFIIKTKLAPAFRVLRVIRSRTSTYRDGSSGRPQCLVLMLTDNCDAQTPFMRDMRMG